MSFEQKEWTSETPITYEELNRIEKGIADTEKMTISEGGTTGQVLVKNSNTDGDTKWVDFLPVIIKSGSKVISATDSNGAQLFTKAEMQTLFGVSSLDITKITGCVLNGDTGAWSGNFLGLRVSKSNSNIYALLDQTVSGTVNMRCNYTLFYQK